MADPLIAVRVEAIVCEAEGVYFYDLRPVGSGALPRFTAGAHIDLHLANNVLRSYSLLNPQGENHRYVVAVAKASNSRGGSRFVHDALRAGDPLSISAPRNNFPLVESALHSVLIAGGIGITPLWCMVQRLVELSGSWSLYYCARARKVAAFCDALEALPSDARARVHFHFDDESGGALLDLSALLRNADPTHHYYCCGPSPMLAAFEAATATLPRDRVHSEYFTAREAPATAGGFSVALARSGVTIDVPPGKTILDALLEAGLDVPHACQMGTCATCETGVIEGTPDHRDVILSPEERASNKTMMICCSGCIGDRLVLDR
jgi:vanillate O-demethylase ferredoxin subunit